MIRYHQSSRYLYNRTIILFIGVPFHEYFPL